ncbi:MAG TPA: PEGA domain-containing protein [bacterium]|nr:PEGA domain-containing protein [bacterium]
MCHAQLPTGVLYCDACGTDLSRAGVLFSTSVRPVSHHGSGAAALVKRSAVIAGAVLALVIGLAGLGSIPQVSARVPVIGTITAPIRGAITQAVEWGSSLVGRESAPTVVEDPPIPTIPGVDAPPVSITPYLVVNSAPDVADVYLNGSLVGRTPLTLYSLNSGRYTVKVARRGYTSVSRRVELKPNEGMTVTLQMKPAAAPKPSAAPRPAAAPKPSAQQPSGGLAPGFTLKDRRGVIYRLSDFRGRRLTLLMIWNLDGEAEQLIRSLQARTGGRDAVVIMIRPNRLALRRFIDTERITVPVLLANPDVAAEYRVPEDVAVLFTISDQGRILNRQIAARR